ncbi:MAG TPA: VOC family protein [Usitatibacter sp.]|nr:VOC family protein [Usitatibacter sp.]
MKRASRFARVSLTVSRLDAAERFYCAALGFERVTVGEPVAYAFGRMRAQHVVLRLGQQEIELVAFDPPGAPYPPHSTSADAWFQHFAIVVDDMARAHAHLVAHGGFTPITLGGPQTLPANTGGVAAFKFRDPDGHPLELLHFPALMRPPAWRARRGGLFLGIDHSAIVVADCGASRAFYESLGLTVGGHSLNTGDEQARLDALDAPVVEVLALHPAAEPTPHVELLAYRAPRVRQRPFPPEENDIAATRMVFAAGGGEGAGSTVLDPDGHRLVLT